MCGCFRAAEELPQYEHPSEVPESALQVQRDVHLLHGEVLLLARQPRVQVCAACCLPLASVCVPQGGGSCFLSGHGSRRACCWELSFVCAQSVRACRQVRTSVGAHSHARQPAQACAGHV